MYFIPKGMMLFSLAWIININQGRTQPVTLGGGAISVILDIVKSHCGLITVREMKYTLQHGCDKTMDDKMTLHAVFCIVKNHGQQSYFRRF